MGFLDFLCYDEDSLFMHVERKFKQYSRYAIEQKFLFQTPYSVPLSRDNHDQQCLIFLFVFLENPHAYHMSRIRVDRSNTHTFTHVLHICTDTKICIYTMWGDIGALCCFLLNNIWLILTLSMHTDSSHSI